MTFDQRPDTRGREALVTPDVTSGYSMQTPLAQGSAQLPAALPDLPAGFWTNFPDNSTPPGHARQPVDVPFRLPQDLESRTVAGCAFRLDGPGGTAGSRLAPGHHHGRQRPDSDFRSECEYALVRNNRKCGIARFLVQ